MILAIRRNETDRILSMLEAVHVVSGFHGMMRRLFTRLSCSVFKIVTVNGEAGNDDPFSDECYDLVRCCRLSWTRATYVMSSVRWL